MSNSFQTEKDRLLPASLIINKVERAEFKEVRELSQTERGEGGFGHTGKQ